MAEYKGKLSFRHIRQHRYTWVITIAGDLHVEIKSRLQDADKAFLERDARYCAGRLGIEIENQASSPER